MRLEMRRVSLGSILTIISVVSDAAPAIINAVKALKLGVTKDDDPDGEPMTVEEFTAAMDAFDRKQEEVGGDVAGRVEKRNPIEG